MINVNQITSQLAKMPDQALQQFAAMHKSDPYTLSLAVAESNRRKELRAAAQAQLTAPPPPKVADQAVAGMAALPAPNMQIPDGGIAGYATGGAIAFSNRGAVEDPDAGKRTRVMGELSPSATWWGDPNSTVGARSSFATVALPDGTPVPLGQMPQFDVLPEGVTPTGSQGGLPATNYVMRGGQPSIGPAADYGRNMGDYLLGRAQGAAPTGAQPRPFQQPAPTSAGQGGMAALSASMSAGAGGGGGGAIPSIPTGDYQSLINARRARTDKEIADFKAANADAGQAYSDAEALAAKKQAGADEDYKYGKGLALLQMAAKMGTTPGTFLTALATGVQSGLPQLALAKKEQSQAQDAVDKLMMTAHEARRAESRGDAKTMLEINSKAADQLDTIQMHEWTAQQEAATKRAKMETERDIAANHDAAIRSGYSLRSAAGAGKMAPVTPMEQSLVRTIATLQEAIVKGQGENSIAPLSPEQLQQMQQQLVNAQNDLQMRYEARASGMLGGSLNFQRPGVYAPTK